MRRVTLRHDAEQPLVCAYTFSNADALLLAEIFESHGIAVRARGELRPFFLYPRPPFVFVWVHQVRVSIVM